MGRVRGAGQSFWTWAAERRNKTFPAWLGGCSGGFLFILASPSLQLSPPLTTDNMGPCSLRGYLPAPPTPRPKYNYELTGMTQASGALSECQEPAVSL